MTDQSTGNVLAVLICRDTESMRSDALDEVEVTLEGFSGDKHSGWTKLSDGRTKFYPRGTVIRNSRQISIVSVEESRTVAERLGIDEIKPEWMGANLLVEGIPSLSELKPNSRLFFESGAVILITGNNAPCSTLSAEIASHFPGQTNLREKIVKNSIRMRGVVAVVELPGSIKKGDSVRVDYSD